MPRTDGPGLNQPEFNMKAADKCKELGNFEKRYRIFS